MTPSSRIAPLVCLLAVNGCDTSPPAIDAGSDALLAPDAAVGSYAESIPYEGDRSGASYRVVRIPSLVATPGGALLAFAEGRTGLFDDGDIDLVVRRSEDLGETWGPIEVVVDLGADTAGNPAPVVDRTRGRIWLPYSSNPGDAMDDRSVWLTFSDDDGRTWAPPRDLTPMVKPAGWTWYATGPGRSIQLSSGRLLVPCNHEEADGSRRSHAIYSDDDGETWQLGGSLAVGTDESQLAELSDGTVLMNARFEGEPHQRALARSTDGGQSWSETTFDPALPDPICQGSLLATPFGLLFSNPATQVEVPRDHVTVRLSLDDGETWPLSRELDPGPSAYSSIELLPDGTIGILWESGRVLPYDRIRFARFDRAWLGDRR